jgi:ribosomal protein S18 acetylase RimI-like enzyme
LLLVDAAPAGVLQTGSPSRKITPGVVLAAVRALGFGALRMPGRLAIMDRVSPKKPDGAFVIAEIKVRESYRGRGRGEKMMARAE